MKIISKFRQHTKVRLRERYGIVCNKEDLKQMRTLILKNESIPIHKLSINVKLHLIKFEGIDIFVLYHKKYKEIITAYPQNNIFASLVQGNLVGNW